MTEHNGSLWMACWEPFTPAVGPVLRLLRQTFRKVARGLSPQRAATVTNTLRICVFARVLLNPEKSLVSR